MLATTVFNIDVNYLAPSSLEDCGILLITFFIGLSKSSDGDSGSVGEFVVVDESWTSGEY